MCNREPQTAQDLAAFNVSVSVTPWSLSIEDDENVVAWLLKKVIGWYANFIMIVVLIWEEWESILLCLEEL